MPRQIVPGASYLITRRCSERRFFLRPDAFANNAFIYCLGLAATHAKVDVLFVVAMSNHYHAGIHDPEGNLPVFCEYFHALLARCLNAYLGRFEGFWSSSATSVVRLVEPNDILEKAVYAYANPSAADLVDAIEEWPGVSSLGAASTNGHLTATRPRQFFRSSGELPETVSVPIVTPEAFRVQGNGEWNETIRERLRLVEAEYRERRRTEGKSVLGRQGILTQDPFACPQGVARRFGMNPSIAAKNRWARSDALKRSKAFLERYRAALAAWIGGVANAVFPYGTYWMRRFARVICETTEEAEPALAATANLTT
jgi:REP element-mobilizing transposase RayT